MIITWLNTIVLAATAKERWGAAGNLNSNEIATKWFLIVGGIILTTLIVSFLITTYKQKRKSSNRVMEHST